MLIAVYLLVLVLEGRLLPWLMGSEAFSDAQVLCEPCALPRHLGVGAASPSGNSCYHGPSPLSEPWLTRTDRSPGRSLAAAIHLGPRVWNPLFQPQLFFLGACSQKLCLPACFVVAPEQGQPTRVPWDVIPG